MSQWSAKDGAAAETTLRVSALLIELTCALLPVRDQRMAGAYVHRTQDAILLNLLQGLSPSEVSVMIQIILRDLSPVLYPPPTPNATASLLKYNSAAYTVVTVEDALRCWTADARSLYCAVADLDRMAWQIDTHLRESAGVCIGIEPLFRIADSTAALLRFRSASSSSEAVCWRPRQSQLDSHTNPRADLLIFCPRADPEITKTRYLRGGHERFDRSRGRRNEIRRRAVRRPTVSAVTLTLPLTCDVFVLTQCPAACRPYSAGGPAHQDFLEIRSKQHC